MSDRTPASALPARLRGFGLAGIAAIVVVLAGTAIGPPVGAVLVLVWAWLSETPQRLLGFVAPRRWKLALPAAILFGVVLELVVRTVVMPLLGAPAVDPAYRPPAGDAGALAVLIVRAVVSAGLCEELIFRGYLFERIGALLGRSRPALAATVALSTALFALAHYHAQGLPGAEQAVLTGAAFGAMFAWRREIALVMAAHAAFDLTAVAQLALG